MPANRKGGAFAPLDPRPDILEIVRQVAFEGWRERARERGRQDPEDLSGSCKFTSLLAQRLFGGRLRGNADHQYLELPGKVRVDLNAEARDVLALQADGIDPWRHDPLFWGNSDHRASLLSCKARVDQWERQVRARLSDRGTKDIPV